MKKIYILLLIISTIISARSSYAIKCNSGSYYDNFDNYEEATINDPLILLNKYMFAINMILDRIALEPASKMYKAIVPAPAKKHISSVFQNINIPLSTISHALMGEFKSANLSLVRFIVNSTLGFGGMIDVAKDFGITNNKAFFTSALQKWGVPDGPYLMLPILGPSTLTSALATTAEFKFYPTNNFYKKHKTIPILKAINRRSSMSGVFNQVKNSVSPYTSAKNLYVQYKCLEK